MIGARRHVGEHRNKSDGGRGEKGKTRVGAGLEKRFEKNEESSGSRENRDQPGSAVSKIRIARRKPAELEKRNRREMVERRMLRDPVPSLLRGEGLPSGPIFRELLGYDAL